MLDSPIILLVPLLPIYPEITSDLSNVGKSNIFVMNYKIALSSVLTCARLERWIHTQEETVVPSQTGVAPCLVNVSQLHSI